MNNHSNNNYNKTLKTLAQEKRRTGTKTEIVIWKEILHHKKLGYKFLRQRPIEKYIVDFFNKQLSLIIEIDGYSHTLDDIKEKDIIRENRLKKLGYSILRFRDEEVLNDIENVKRTILGFINGKIR